MLRRTNVRNILRYSQCGYSTANPSTVATKLTNTEEKKEETGTEQSKLIAAAFASLKEISWKSKNKDYAEVDQLIHSAQDVSTLLSIVDDHILSRSQSLKIVTVLANWGSQGKIKLTDFEMDLRFAKLCQLLGRNKNANVANDMADLSVVLGVTADEQAAKLISSINLQQMINILISLGSKKRRSLPLLRSLAFNIGRCTETLNVKQASDVIYNLAVLNYPDEVLLEKVIGDIRDNLFNVKKSSIICSIITSIGILRFRDIDLLENLYSWIIANKSICKSKDFLSLLMTSANVNYMSCKFDKLRKLIQPLLNQNEMVDISTWINVVWCLAVLNKCDENTLNSTLNPEFLQKLIMMKLYQPDDGIPLKLKLLNINGVAKSMGNTYKGNLLEENSDIFKTPLLKTKEKQILFDSVLETIANFSKIDECFQLNVDSGLGFLIDAVCYLDTKKNIVKLNAEQSTKNKKIAIMINTYHDFCRGCHYEVTGLTALSHRLLKENGYEVVTIPFTEYDLKDTLVNRVQYLNQKIRETES